MNERMGCSLEVTLHEIVSMTMPDPGSEVRSRLLAGRKTHENETRGHAAVCVLFAGKTFEESKILLTERAMNLATHAGQVAFPGGMAEPQDQGDLTLTALRECEEEVGIPQTLPRAVGCLPLFPTMTGHFEVTPVLAYLNEAVTDLRFSAEEVTQGEWVSVQLLRQTRALETRELSTLDEKYIEVQAPYFMWGSRKMWGLSAWIFDLILSRYDTIRE